MSFEADRLKLYKINRECDTRLNEFTRRVREGRDVQSASEFAKFLLWSGILDFLKAYPQDPPLRVDGNLLESNCKTLISLCNDRFRTNSTNPCPTRDDQSSMHQKLDLIAGYLAKLSPVSLVMSTNGTECGSPPQAARSDACGGVP